MDIKPIVLQGRWVRLEPLAEMHIPELAAAGRDEAIWQFMRYGLITTGAGMRAWVMELLEAQAHGTDLPFAVVHLESGVTIGSTRYMEIRRPHRSLEIGGTWYALPFQRTAVNTECKYLLLRHAFEELSCLRVQFKTDLRNERSQRALERISAVKEGVLRNHMVLPDGTIRHSVYYSIIDSEWLAVKTLLQGKLGYFN